MKEEIYCWVAISPVREYSQCFQTKVKTFKFGDVVWMNSNGYIARKPRPCRHGHSDPPIGMFMQYGRELTVDKNTSNHLKLFL